MNFFTYLDKLFKEVKGIGKTSEAAKNAQAELDDFLTNYDSNNTPKASGEYATNVKTNADIKGESKALYDTWLAGELDSLEGEHGIKTQEQQLKKNKLDYDYANTLDDIETSYKNALETSKNASVKQGVARSSINDYKNDAIDAAKNQTTERTEQSYKNSLESIDLALNSLEQKRKSAINDLDFSYAEKVEARIKKLTTERDNQLKAIEEENKTEVDAQRSAALYAKSDGLLSQMKPSEAREYVMNNLSLKSNLTPYQYYQLYKKYC